MIFHLGGKNYFNYQISRIDFNSVRMDDKKMIEALTRIAEAQENQADEWKKVTDGLSSINARLDKIDESIKCIDQKLDQTSKETTINTERIQNLKEQFSSEKIDVSKEFDIVHGSIQRRDGHFRWLMASVVIPMILALVAIFKPN